MIDGANSSSALKRNNTAIGLIIVFLLIAVSITFWYKVYINTNQVFWGMMDNNLATAGVTRHFTQGDQRGSLDQYIKLQFGSTNAVNTLVTFNQNQNNVKATAKSESIGTPKTDYSRYISINTTQKNSKGKPINTANIVGIWSKTDASATSQRSPQYFKQNVFSLIPFGNFNRDQRNTLIKMMKDKNVYKISGVKSSKLYSHAVYVYDVNVSPLAYVNVLLQYAKELGLDNTGIDASQYQNAQPLQVQISVDKMSRNILRLSYPSTKQTVDYSAQGIENSIKIPSHTITDTDLQQRIQKSLQ